MEYACSGKLRHATVTCNRCQFINYHGINDERRNSKGIADSPEGIYEERYVTCSGNRGFTFAENPMFVNPTIGDYRLRDGVDFFYIPFEEMGRY